MKPRLNDIAVRAGVSEATVSRVVNGKAGVAEETRRAVLTAIDVLGYERPARLRHASAGLVGLIVPELENPVFPHFAQVIEQELARHGYTPVLCSQSPGGVHEDAYVEMLLDRGVAGIVFVSGIHAVAGTNATRYTRLKEVGLPIAFINGYVPGVPAPFISADDRRAVDLAVGHLVQLGHTSIGLAMGPQRYVHVGRRIAAFRDAMRRLVDPSLADGKLDELIECAQFLVEGGAAAADALIDRGATAVVCGSDPMALGAIRAAHRRGLHVPADVSVVGSDDNPFLEFTDPPLTTVRQPVRDMAIAAVAALLDEIGGVPGPRSEYLFRPELVVRGSTGPVVQLRGAGPSAPRLWGDHAPAPTRAAGT